MIEGKCPGDTREIILKRIQEQFVAWREAVTIDMVDIKRLSGLSNACYRVSAKDSVRLPDETPRVLLYRKFECQVIDKRVEEVIFKCMSDTGLGPKLLF